MPLLIVIGPAKSTPIAKKGRTSCTLSFGERSINSSWNLNLVSVNLIQRDITERTITRSLNGQYFNQYFCTN